jgi:ABC-type ATPase involved in cell division
LDAGRSDRLLKVLHQTSQTGQTILVATHQLEWAEQLAQRVLHLQRGALVQESDRVDWQALRLAIAQVEAEEAAEWE